MNSRTVLAGTDGFASIIKVFSVRPIVLSLARSTMCSSTTFSSSRGRLQRAKPSGAGERVSAINFASATPSRGRRHPGSAQYSRSIGISPMRRPHESMQSRSGYDTRCHLTVSTPEPEGRARCVSSARRDPTESSLHSLARPAKSA
jgi:hypothetical protein